MINYLNELKKGENILTKVGEKHDDMLMDISVFNMSKGEEKKLSSETQETAVLLLTGKIELSWEGRNSVLERGCMFDENPVCLHVPKGVAVDIKVLEDSEVLVQKTENNGTFDSKLYSKEDTKSEIFGDGVWDGTARRVVRTVFDYNNAPYSNMVLGEVINYPGKWSSYPPHHHPQPEVYFYKFNKPQGFGLCLVGEEAYKIKNNSFLTIDGGQVHPQTTAPGYAMFYCWMIRHFDGNPWTERIDEEDHKWLLEKDVKIWPEK